MGWWDRCIRMGVVRFRCITVHSGGFCVFRVQFGAFWQCTAARVVCEGAVPDFACCFPDFTGVPFNGGAVW